eukprot:scaffold92258_cov50-Phaeocystis_antarctica.AAC.1
MSSWSTSAASSPCPRTVRSARHTEACTCRWRSNPRQGRCVSAAAATRIAIAPGIGLGFGFAFGFGLGSGLGLGSGSGLGLG